MPLQLIKESKIKVSNKEMVWMINIINLWVVICISNKKLINPKEFRVFWINTGWEDKLFSIMFLFCFCPILSADLFPTFCIPSSLSVRTAKREKRKLKRKNKDISEQCKHCLAISIHTPLSTYSSSWVWICAIVMNYIQHLIYNVTTWLSVTLVI